MWQGARVEVSRRREKVERLFWKGMNGETDEKVLTLIAGGTDRAGAIERAMFGATKNEKNMRTIDKALQRLRRKNLIEHRAGTWHVVGSSKKST